MDKISVLLLIALGTEVNAQDNVVNTMVDRASNQIADLNLDLDAATLAKGNAAGGGPQGKLDTRGFEGKKVYRGKEFGGTTKLLSGNGMNAQEKSPPTPGYWGGGNTPKPRVLFGGGKLDTRGFEGKRVYRGKEFGGTNKLLAGAGMAAQEQSPQTPTWWGGKQDTSTINRKMGINFDPKTGKKLIRAIPDEPSVTPAPGLGGFPGTRPLFVGGRSFVGSRPFLLADLSKGTALSNIAFFVTAMSMIALAVFLSRRSSSTSDNELCMALS